MPQMATSHLHIHCTICYVIGGRLQDEIWEKNFENPNGCWVNKLVPPVQWWTCYKLELVNAQCLVHFWKKVTSGSRLASKYKFVWLLTIFWSNLPFEHAYHIIWPNGFPSIVQTQCSFLVWMCDTTERGFWRVECCDEWNSISLGMRGRAPKKMSYFFSHMT